MRFILSILVFTSAYAFADETVNLRLSQNILFCGSSETHHACTSANNANWDLSFQLICEESGYCEGKTSTSLSGHIYVFETTITVSKSKDYARFCSDDPEVRYYDISTNHKILDSTKNNEVIRENDSFSITCTSKIPTSGGRQTLIPSENTSVDFSSYIRRGTITPTP